MIAFAAQQPNRRTGQERRERADPTLVTALRGAIERDEIEVLFQPQFAASDNRLIGAEALARWRHPVTGLMGAAALFERAQRAQQAVQVSRHIARRAVAIAAEWHPTLKLSLNITAQDLAQADFARFISHLIMESGFPAHRLTLEITEHSLVADLAHSAEVLSQVAASGVRIALDDFGTGFCNFSYLKLLPLHALKLDRSMVEGIASGGRDLAVLHGIVEMARALDLEVIAEGVETEAQRAAIVAEGCSGWQGFFGAAPLSADDFLSLIG